MNRGPRVPKIVGRFKDRVEPHHGLGGVIAPPSQFDGRRYVGRHCFADALEDSNCAVRIREPMATTSLGRHFAHRAGQVHVDRLKAAPGNTALRTALQECGSCSGHEIRLASHELRRKGPILMTSGMTSQWEQALHIMAVTSIDGVDVQHGFRDRIRTTVPARNDAHRRVRETGESSLLKWGIELWGDLGDSRVHHMFARECRGVERTQSVVCATQSFTTINPVLASVHRPDDSAAESGARSL